MKVASSGAPAQVLDWSDGRKLVVNPRQTRPNPTFCSDENTLNCCVCAVQGLFGQSAAYRRSPPSQSQGVTGSILSARLENMQFRAGIGLIRCPFCASLERNLYECSYTFNLATLFVTPSAFFSRNTISPNSMFTQSWASSVKGSEAKMADVASSSELTSSL